MKRTSPLRSSRRDGQKTYMERIIRNPDKEVMPSERCLVCREFRPKSGLPTVGSLKKSARVSGVIPETGVPTKVGSSDCVEFQPKSGLPTYLTENHVRIWPFGFRSELFQTRGKLENKAWRGFLLG